MSVVIISFFLSAVRSVEILPFFLIIKNIRKFIPQKISDILLAGFAVLPEILDNRTFIVLVIECFILD